MNNLDYYFLKYNTDKSSKHHNYARQYDKILEPYRYNESFNYLEIGIFNGESLNAFREYFDKYDKIVGIDINPECKKYETDNINVEIGDQTDEQFLYDVNKKYAGFNIILDDGSHRNDHTIKTFEFLFPLLKDEGVYIIEDTNIYNNEHFYNTSYPNHLDYFKQYIEFLNQSRYNSVTGIKDYCCDPFKIQKRTKDVFEYSIDKIEFGCGYIAVYKKIRTHWI